MAQLSFFLLLWLVATLYTIIGHGYRIRRTASSVFPAVRRIAAGRAIRVPLVDVRSSSDINGEPSIERQLSEVRSESDKTSAAIDAIQVEIDEVGSRIEEIESAIKNPNKLTDIDYLKMKEMALRAEKEQLRRKEEQLRTKEEQLRAEKNLLLANERQGLVSPPLAETADYFKKFLEYCCKPPVNHTVHLQDAVEDASTPIVPSSSSVLQVQYKLNGTDEVLAYVLPEGMPWPLMKIAKQTNADYKDVVAVRDDPVSRARRSEVVNDALSGTDYVIVGTPGIGKSAEMNIVLLELLREMNKTQELKTLFFRSSHFVTLFYIDSATKTIKLKVLARVNSLDKFEELVEDAMEKPSIAVVELAEKEEDPICLAKMIVSTSARMAASKVTKTLSKRGAGYLLSDPPPVDQLLLQVRSLRELSQDRNRGNVTGGDTKTVLTEVKNRAEIVGPLMRYVLDENLTSERVDSINSTKATTLLQEMPWADFENVPSHLKLFAAPFVKQGIEVPYARSRALNEGKRYEYRLLSAHCGLALSKLMTTTEEIALLVRYGFAYMVGECIVSAGLLAKHQNTVYRQAEWEIYDDSADRLLRSQDRRTDGFRFPIADKTVLLSNQFFYGNVAELKEKTLYRPLVHNFPVYDMALVDHTKKEYYCFQSTDKSLPDHPFRLENIATVMNNLEMGRGGAGEDYTLVLVACIDWSKRMNHGMRFKYDVDGEQSEPFDLKTLQNMISTKKKSKNNIPEEVGWVINRLQLRIVRCCYYPNVRLSKGALSGKPEKRNKKTKKMPVTEDQVKALKKPALVKILRKLGVTEVAAGKKVNVKLLKEDLVCAVLEKVNDMKKAELVKTLGEWGVSEIADEKVNSRSVTNEVLAQAVLAHSLRP